MPETRNTSLVAAIDCAGGGQVWIDGTTLFVAHINPPAGTSIYDVADPRHPRLLAQVEMPPGYHSHKVRARDGLMIVNHESNGEDGDPAEFGGGLGIYDVSTPSRPTQIASGAPAARACTASISTAATPISRRPPTAMSATS